MPLLDLFWTMLVLFVWIAWFWLVITIFFDLFRSHDLGGWGKALWAIFIVILPFIGVLVYLIARGGAMQQRAIDAAAAQEKATKQYIRDVSSQASTAEEIGKLDALRQQGVITDHEFQQQKAKLLA